MTYDFSDVILPKNLTVSNTALKLYVNTERIITICILKFQLHVLKNSNCVSNHLGILVLWLNVIMPSVFAKH